MRRTGFTLVELLIVMAVIAALISIIQPMGMNALKQARTVQQAVDLRGIMTEVTGKVAAKGKTITLAIADYPGYKTEMTAGTEVAPLYGLILTGLNFDTDYLESAFGDVTTLSTTNTQYFDSTTRKLVFTVSNYLY